MIKVIVFLLIAFVITQKFDFKKPTDDDSNYCERNFEVTCSGKSCLAKSDGCTSTQNQKQLKEGFQKIGFVINDEKMPFFSLGVGELTEGPSKNYADFQGYRFSLVVSNLVQYKNLDANCDYDPLVDEIVKMYNLSDYAWADVVKNVVSDKITEFYIIGTSQDSPTVEIWAIVTKETFVQEGDGETPVISPSTVKIAVNVTDITYETDTEGFSISVLMISGKKTRTRTQTQTQTQYKPEDPNTVSNAYGVPDEEDDEDIGFFAFEKRVKTDGSGTQKEWKQSEPKLQPTKLQSQQMTQLRQRLQIQEGTNIEEIWFSICDKPEFVFWDPIVGALDQSSGFLYSVGLFFLLVVIFIHF